MTAGPGIARIIEARRALVLHDRPLVVDLITLTLNHGVFVVRAASSLEEVQAILEDWVPNLSVVDMDHDDAPRCSSCSVPRTRSSGAGRRSSG